MKRNPLGIIRVISKIKLLLSNNLNLPWDMRIEWRRLNSKQRERVLNAIRRIIQRDLLGEEFLKTIAQEVLPQEGQVNLEGKVVQYILKRLFHGDTYKFLKVLQQIKVDHNEQEKKKRYRTKI